MPDYARSERIAIKMDSGITESEAIRQTDAELKAKQKPESVLKAELLRQKIKMDHAEKMAKKSTRHNYE
jgi:uncharacterized protein YoaH (UPF0181 family)